MLGLVAPPQLRKLGEDFDAARRQPDTDTGAATATGIDVGGDWDQPSFGSRHISINMSESAASGLTRAETQRTADVMSKVKSDTITSKSANL